MDFLNKIRIIFFDAFISFKKNKDLTASSSLAFAATLALIPTLFLLLFLLSAIIGSSERTLARTQEMLLQLIPSYSQDVIREMRFISSYMGTIGILNILVLIWSVTPLVAEMRLSIGTIFRNRPNRPYLLEKLLDVIISIVFLMGLSAITILGVIFTLTEKQSLAYVPLKYIEGLIPFVFIIVVVFLLYYTFSAKAVNRHLVIGSLVTSILWFMMTPAFHLFITYNPGYGFAFGSFKSLFVVIIWIYYSLVVFLFGAEIAASLGRDETVFIKKLIEGNKYVPVGIISKYVVRYKKGSIIFREGDPGDVMYGVLQGKVEIYKADKALGVILPGKCFGAVSFILSIPRVASTRALEDVELVIISNDNIDKMMNEYPEFVIEILREIAFRLRESNKVVD
ncbi:MAG TPA: YhjD/YihY/BrkB family envelope integrity protein [Nitrospirota bacterium]|nr:YhjD/YihY/BrkB family envelope integrity protein [Nitrospirota bacterium]